MPDWVRWATTEFVDLEVLGRLLLAALLGAIVGLERERSQKAAGLRTNILICLGSALVMETSRDISRGVSASLVDPTRMAAQVVSGIGFIGAGTILVARGRVVIGLTTAATIWVVAAIGIAVGAEAYTHAVATTLLIVFVLTALSRLEGSLFERNGSEVVEVEMAPGPGAIDRLRELLREEGLRTRLSEIEKDEDAVRVLVEIRGPGGGRDAALDRLTREHEVRRVSLVSVKPARSE